MTAITGTPNVKSALPFRIAQAAQQQQQPKHQSLLHSTVARATCECVFSSGFVFRVSGGECVCVFYVCVCVCVRVSRGGGAEKSILNAISYNCVMSHKSYRNALACVHAHVSTTTLVYTCNEV